MFGGRYKNVKGRGKYKWVKAPPDYPGHVYTWGKRVLEHHLVWWRHTGEVVPSGWIIHHKNGDRGDNAYANLSPPEPNGVHTREHNLQEDDKKLKCAWCGKPITRTARDVRSKNKLGQKRFFCCDSHAALQQQKEGSTGYRKAPHGTYGGYRRGCHCAKCRRANTERARVYRSKKGH